MERQKTYEHFHYNATGPMAESTGAASQMPAQGSSGYDGTNPRPVNYSVQTGEEFSLEFMRERANPRKISAQNASGDHSNAGCVGMKRTLEVSHAESKSGSDVLMFPAGEKASTNDLDSKNQHASGNSAHYEAARSMPHASSADSSSYGILGYASSGASVTLAKRMKFLCSFGGRILPRPSDGKLRYVGGSTRVIQVIKDISWQEFVHKTMTIYNQAHTIKYQLPGEDLDALVSVSCDEDLQNMMEECSIAAVGEGSQKLRMFLFSSGDSDHAQIGLGSMEGDSERQYVVAVNSMDVQSGMISSGHYQTTRSANDLDLLNLNDQGDKEVKKPNIESLSTNAATVVDATLSPFADPPASINCIQVPFCGTSVAMPVQELLPSKQGVITEGSSGGLQVGKEMPVNENLKAEGFFSQTAEHEQTGSSESEVYRHFIQEGLASKLLQAAELSYEASFQENKSSVLASKSKDLLESEVPEEGLSPFESGIDNLKYELNNEGLGASCADHISGSETDIAEISYHDVPSHPFRVFHSESIPREQLDLANRLSKSNDSIGSQFLIPHSHAAFGQQESISEYVDPFHEISLVSHSEKPSQSGKDSYFNIATVRDGMLQLEKCKEVADATTRAHQLENVSAEGNPQTMKLGHHSLFSTPKLSNDNSLDADDVRVKCTGHTTNDQTVAAEDQSFKAGEKLQKSELLHPLSVFSDDKRTINDDKASLEDDKSRHHGSYLSDSEKGKMKVCLTGLADRNTELSGSTGIVSAVSKKQENPTSGLFEVHWGNISAESMNSKEAKGQTPSFAWSVNSSGGASEPESSACNASSQCKDILIDINDRFPRDLLSDLFYKARNNEDSVSTKAVHKDEAGLSVNIHNPEPKHWSFFRNLAQDEFKHKAVSLIDQDQIPYPSSYMNVEGEGPVTYEFSPSNRDADYNVSQIDFDEEIQISSDNANDPSTIASLYIPSQAVAEGVRTGSPSRSPLSDYEETKLDNSVDGGPAMVIPLSDHDLQMIKNEDLEELRELGSGTFGTVYHGKWRGTDIAIKRIKKSCFVGRLSEQERLTSDFWREAEILSKLHHPNVVAFYGIVKDGPGGILATVTEYMVNGSLRHVLLRNDRYLDRRKRLIIARDAAIGMEYLHSKLIVHFDLKCDNLLVNLKDPQRPICKVGDFGLSKIKKNTLVSGGVRGTLPWMAPELFNDSSKVSEKVDVFSFGIVMWEILTGDEPYANMHDVAIIGGIASNTLRPAVPASCDPEWRRLMERCWAPDPLQRPTFTEISSQLHAMSMALESRTQR